MQAMPTADSYTAPPRFLPSGDPGASGGGTYTGVGAQPAVANYEAFLGPAGRDIRLEPERNRRKQRLHMPDIPTTAVEFIEERIDGIVEGATNSPYTTLVLPYRHHVNVDGKLKWNVQSFDQALASRTPYEAGVRVMTQTTQRFAGYMVRMGIGMALEVNFMLSERGRQNFRLQLEQMIKAIQDTNDYDAVMALLKARSYQRQVDEQYHSTGKTQAQRMCDYVQFFGLMQKNANGLDAAIVDAQQTFKSWDAKPPTFIICNERLTTQLTMNPERTQYFLNGEDGVKRLKTGPNLSTYRGLHVIHSKRFSTETGELPRDPLERRVRVGEYHRIPWHKDNPERTFEFYDESRDSWFSLTWDDLLRAARLPGDLDESDGAGSGDFAAKTSADFFADTFLKESGADTDARIVLDNPSNTTASHCIYVPQSVARVLPVSFHFRFETIHSDMKPNRDFGVVPGAGFAGKWVAFFMTREITADIASALLQPVTMGYRGDQFKQRVADACLLGLTINKYGVGANASFLRPAAAIDASVVFSNTYYQHADSILAVMYAAMVSTGETQRRALAEALRSDFVRDVKAVYNALVDQAGGSFVAPSAAAVAVDLAKGPTFEQTEMAYRVPPPPSVPDKHCDTFLLFLWCMLLRFYTGIDGACVHVVKNGYFKASGAAIPLATLLAGMDDSWWVESLSDSEAFRVVTGGATARAAIARKREIVLLRPNIEHSMLAAIIGRGGSDDLGSTFWGQTHLECQNDTVHSLWGLSYKWHSRALVYNEKHLIRMFDLCYGGYSGGKDCSLVDWHNDGPERWREATNNTRDPYEGPSLAVMSFPVCENDPDWLRNWPSPIAFHGAAGSKLPVDPENCVHATDSEYFTMHGVTYRERFLQYQARMPNFTELHLCNKHAGELADENVTSIQSALAFQGSMRIVDKNGARITEVNGCGHHGPDYVGAASRRNGKGMDTTGRPGMAVFGAT